MHMIKRLLSLNHFACHLLPTLSLLLVISVSIFLSSEMVHADISCNPNHLMLQTVTDNHTGRTYTISGYCAINEELSAMNLDIKITAIWTKSNGTGVETVISEFGQLIRTFQCDYDPWLEPASNCNMTSHDYSPKLEYGRPVSGTSGEFVLWAQSWWADYEDMNFRQNFPTSALALDQYKRRELASQAMTRTLKIIDPVENQSFASPDLMVTAVMERPVINPPDYHVLIKVEEIAWPEAGIVATNRNYEIAKGYQKTANQLITYFHMKGKDLWGAKWGVSAHVMSSELDWTPVTYFTVDSLSSGNAEPPEYILNPPQIHKPRNNRTYTVEENIPLWVTGDPEAEMTVEVSSRPAGAATAFKHYYTRTGPSNSPGSIDSKQSEIWRAAMFTRAEIAEVKIEAFIEKPDILEGRSNSSVAFIQVLVPKPAIGKPEENTKYSVPAEVNLILPRTWKTNSKKLNGKIEMEVESKRPGGIASVSNVFLPYTDNSYIVSKVFNTWLIKYQLKDLGKYRFRARVAYHKYFPIDFETPWTDWRQIEVLGLIDRPGATIITIDKPTSAMQKVDRQQLQSKTSAEKPQLQSDQVVPTVTVKKPGLKLKTAPVFVQPQKLQQIARRGSVSLKVRGIEDMAQLDWHVEYKKFGTSRYSRSRVARPQVVGGNNQVSGSFYAREDGDYRIRVRSKEKGSLWSQWRLFRVGNPKVTINEERSLKPAVKKPKVKNRLTPKAESPEQKGPNTLKPTENIETPKLKKPSIHDNKPIIINNS